MFSSLVCILTKPFIVSKLIFLTSLTIITAIEITHYSFAVHNMFNTSYSCFKAIIGIVSIIIHFRFKGTRVAVQWAYIIIVTVYRVSLPYSFAVHLLSVGATIEFKYIISSWIVHFKKWQKNPKSTSRMSYCDLSPKFCRNESFIKQLWFTNFSWNLVQIVDANRSLLST